ncbi:MAG TPA: UDP-N-acetylglucosamine 2-epimerase [Candidatus Nanoarchaeia archaeon]|nr:UDP-N-acetylglucosamine 2-epimerase [Candidatus Nanoarchaeia archaeon]
MIAIVLGTKAELIKTMPVMKELDKRKIPYSFIHTGQHSLGELLEDFKLKKPDVVLYEPPKLSSRFMVKTHKAIFWGMSLVPKIISALRKLKPKYVIYHGDTMSASAAAVASKLAGCKGVHLEAGLRSGSLLEPFPEEISRQICDSFSSVLLAVSDLTESTLRNEGRKGEIVKAGNTIVDSVKICLKLNKTKPKAKGYVVVNIHRHENIKSKERLVKIVGIIASVERNVIWPIHDNTKQQLIKFGLWEKLQKQNIELWPLISYIDFIHLLANCKYIITDGGSIQEESLSLRKPCILLRRRTERIEGLSTGLNFLTDLHSEKALGAINQIESGLKVKDFQNPYGNGDSAGIIVDYLTK